MICIFPLEVLLRPLLPWNCTLMTFLGQTGLYIPIWGNCKTNLTLWKEFFKHFRSFVKYVCIFIFKISGIPVKKSGKGRNNYIWKLLTTLKKTSNGNTLFLCVRNCANCTKKRSLTMPNWAEFCVNRRNFVKKSPVRQKKDFALILNTLESDFMDKAFLFFYG